MATTIYTYLHNDDLNGSKIVSMDDCMCKLYDILRNDSDFLKDFEHDLQSPAIYILINKNESKAYIGETDDFNKRIAHHIANKSFWTEAIVFMGTNNDTLTKTEVQYLEYLAIDKAKKSGSYDLSENSQSGKIPHMNVMLKGKTDKFFKYVQFLAKFVGCDIFEKRAVVTPVEQTSDSMVSRHIHKPITICINVTPSDLNGKVSFIINGKEYKTKGIMGYAIVKEYLEKNPNTTLEELKDIFHNGLLGRWGGWNFIEDNIEYAKTLKKETSMYRHHVKDEYILTSGDGVRFVVSNQWEKGNVPNLLQLASDWGWEFEIKK